MRALAHCCHSSHMIDLSEESNEENIETCVKYFTRMAKMNRKLDPSQRKYVYHADPNCRVARDGNRFDRW